MSGDSSGARLGRRIHLVCGKGGVGRTTLAAALAGALAASGRRVLLAEVEDSEEASSPLARLFGRERLESRAKPLGPASLSGIRLSGTRGQELFARSVFPAGPLIRQALRTKALRRFLAAVPSLQELGVFYHLLALLRESRSDGRPEHESVVIDMPATGQTLGLTALPQVLLGVLPEGPIPAIMREGQSYLNDPKRCLAWVATLPELLPVTEALELVEGLEATDVVTGGVFLNRVPVDPFEAEERQALEDLLAEEPVHGEFAFQRLAAVERARAILQAESQLPVLELPELPGDDPAVRLAALQRHFGAWLERA